MENSPALKALIRKNATLFWYIDDTKKEDLPLEVVVEFFLNYADEESINELFNIVGIKKVAEVFRGQIDCWKDRSNYVPVIQNYFTLFFQRHAS